MTPEEHIYDTEIAPLLGQVGALCEKHGIPLLAFVEWGDGFGTTRLLPEYTSLHFLAIEVLSRCRSADDGSYFNFDAFGFAVAKKIGPEACKTSMLLNPRRLESTP